MINPVLVVVNEELCSFFQSVIQDLLRSFLEFASPIAGLLFRSFHTVAWSGIESRGRFISLFIALIVGVLVKLFLWLFVDDV